MYSSMFDNPEKATDASLRKQNIYEIIKFPRVHIHMKNPLLDLVFDPATCQGAGDNLMRMQLLISGIPYFVNGCSDNCSCNFPVGSGVFTLPDLGIHAVKIMRGRQGYPPFPKLLPNLYCIGRVT